MAENYAKSTITSIRGWILLLAKDSVSKTALFDIDFGHETSKKKIFEKSPEKIFRVEKFFFEDGHNNKQTILYLLCESRFLSRKESHGPSDREPP